MNGDQRVVVFEGILIRCATVNGMHIPQESVSLHDLIATIKDEMLTLNSQTQDKQENRKLSRSAIHTQTPYKPFYRLRLKSEEEAVFDDASPISKMPSRRRASSTSSGIPQSILIPLQRQSSYSDGSCTSEDECGHEARKQAHKQARLLDQLHWMRTQGKDCVALENLKDTQAVVDFVRVITRFTTPAALEFKLNQNGTITVSYQFLLDFKNDYMMLKVGQDYCMFLSPF